MTRPVVFSASSVRAYEDCHLRWYFTYILLDDGDTSEPQSVGVAFHDSVEKLLRDPDDFVAYYQALQNPDVGPLVTVFITDIAPTYGEPVLIEAPFQLEVNGIPYSGILDALDRQDVPWGYAKILRDHKTTNSRPRPGRYRFAMTGYWMGATDLGFEPDAAQLDYVVRTKKPYYWPEPMDPITDLDIGLFARSLETVAEGVAKGDFRPTGLGTRACSYCPVQAVCGPYSRMKEVTAAS